MTTKPMPPSKWEAHARRLEEAARRAAQPRQADDLVEEVGLDAERPARLSDADNRHIGHLTR